MKKMILVATFTAVVTLGSASTALAAVVFNTETGQYYSTSEEDGTIYFTNKIPLEDNYRGTSVKCLENLVPTEENLTLEAIDAEITTNVMENNQVKRVYQYVPENDLIVFALNSHGEEDLFIHHVEVINSETEEVIARGSNLLINQIYKSIKVIPDVPVRIEITTSSLILEDTGFQVGSTDSRFAQAIPDVVNTIPTPRETGLVPRNIDGTQGKVMESYRLSGRTDTVLKCQFRSLLR